MRQMQDLLTPPVHRQQAIRRNNPDAVILNGQCHVSSYTSTVNGQMERDVIKPRPWDNVIVIRCAPPRIIVKLHRPEYDFR